MALSFKSVGQRDEDRLARREATKSSARPIGFVTPFKPSQGDGIFARHFSIINQIHDNFRNLLLTNHGERLGLYDFGANLKPLTTEISSRDDFDAEAMQRIKIAAAKWMPFIDLQTFETVVDLMQNIHTGKIRIKVVYGVPMLGISDRVINVTLYVI